MDQRLNWSLVLLVFILASHTTDVLAKHHHIKLRHARHRRQHGESYLPASFVLDTDEEESGTWGPWSTPSSCSRSCGGGVAHQTRSCQDIDESTQSDLCTGAKKRFFSCNVQDCPEPAQDFRAEQCAEFNNVPIEGVYYDWIPYTGGPNKCELNCMPRGQRFFYRHRLSVTDGTPCTAEKNDVCVQGKCRPVGCDMMLGSDAKEDRCRECGGDGSGCNTVHSLLDMDDLQVGYNDILLIPEGATNIAISEVRPSNNYLAIRNASGHYYLNGNWRIDFPRSLRFAGTVFHYERRPKEFSAADIINALGPTSEAIYIVLLYQDTNVGVNYEYSIPQRFSQQSNPDTYTWVVEEFSNCSVECGGGIQSRHVRCVKRADNEEADASLCDQQLEPDSTQACGVEPCPPEWVIKDWGPCSKRCGSGGEQSREIQCEQIISGGIPSLVDDARCLDLIGPKDIEIQECNKNVECPQWHTGPWKPCDRLCGKGKQTRKVTCYKKEGRKKFVLDDSACEEERPESEMPCELRPCSGVDWVVSKWSGCDDNCGLTHETRTTSCVSLDGAVYPDSLCNAETKPALVRECSAQEKCAFQWYASQWSECSAKCGTGIQTRKVFCGTSPSDNEGIKQVDDEKCDSAKKYNTTQDCVAEVEECKGEWFTGPWTECSKPCGGGEKTRKVICMRENKVVPITGNCYDNDIMFSIEDCNKEACNEDEVIPVGPGKLNAATEDDEEECEEYQNDGFEPVDSDLDIVDYQSDVGMDVDVSPSRFSSDGKSSGYALEDFMLGDDPRTLDDKDDDGSGVEDGDDYPEEGFESTSDSSSSFSTSETESTESPETSDTDSTESTITGSTESTYTDTTSSDDTSSTSSQTSVTPVSSVTTEDPFLGINFEETIPKRKTPPPPESAPTISSTTESGITSDSTSESSSDTSETSSTGETSEISSSSTVSSSEETGSTATSESTSDTGSTESPETLGTTGSTDSTESGSTSSDGTGSTPSETSVTPESSASTVAESSGSDGTASTDISSASSSETPESSSSDTTESSSSETTISSGSETSGSSSSDATGSSSLDTTVSSSSGTTGLSSSVTTESASSDTTVSSSSETPGSSSSATTESSSSETTGSSSSETSGSSSSDATGSSSSDTTVSTGLSSSAITESASSATTESSSSGTTGSSSSETTDSSSSDITVSSSSETPGSSSSETSGSSSSATTESSSSGTTGSSSSETTELSSSDTTVSSSSETTELSSSDTTVSSSSETTESSSSDTTVSSSSETPGSSSSETTESSSSASTESFTPGSTESSSSGSTELSSSGSTESSSSGSTESSSSGTTESSSSGSTELSSSGSTESSSSGLTESSSSGTTESSSSGSTELSSSGSTESSSSGSTETFSSGSTESSSSGSTESSSSGSTEFSSSGSTESSSAGLTEAASSVSTESPSSGSTESSSSGSTESSSSGSTESSSSGSTESSSSGSTELSSSVSTESSSSETPGSSSSDTTVSSSSETIEQSSSGSTISSSSVTPELSSTDTTESSSSDTTESSSSTETTESSSLETTTLSSSDTTTSGSSSPSSATTESSSSTDITGSESTGPFEETTETGETTESESTTVSGETEITTESDTTESGITETDEDLDTTGQSHITDIWTTAIPTIQQGRRICKPKTCKSSPFGCCWDGVKAAKGPFGKGCPVPKTCKEAEFGCCPDEVSPATGPNNEGCPDSHCDETLFGCCPDDVTPAEGNDNEGCPIPCNESEFGCCPDGKTPASGKDNLGCCNLTKHGCCPDGIEPASGPDGEGCEEKETSTITTSEAETTTESSSTVGLSSTSEAEGTATSEVESTSTSESTTTSEVGVTTVGGAEEDCENSAFGCCNDGSTPAHGPNNEGCCLATPYGCCPDNIRHAQGPDLWGCGCQYSRYGCCPDNTTTARGANNEGCACQYTLHGCCPDRLATASGPNFEGCACHTYQFGCCPDGITTAKGPQGLGCGCENTEFKCCSDGVTPAKGENYAGCTCDSSKYGCCPDGDEEAQGENFEGCLTVPSNPGAACALERDRGSCSDFSVRWFFDTEYGGCSRFWYGGCEGNENRFKSQEECKDVCVEPKGRDACFLPKISGPCEEYLPMWYYDAERKQCGQFVYKGCLGNANKFKTKDECEDLCEIPDDADPCEQSKEVGPCEGNFTRWYFNKESDSCEEFAYGGCKGNKNNFRTQISCQQQCLTPGLSRVQDVCALEKEPGPCPGSLLRWYYDPKRRTCRQFVFGGCKGNGNKFRTYAACAQRCPVREQDTCLLPALLGDCYNYTKRWYYDSYEERCRQFYYGGCGGNGNNFETENDCTNRCKSLPTTPAPITHPTTTPPPAVPEFRTEFCFLGEDFGPCYEDSVKWFYDSRNGICKQFRYGGCGGNGNKFDTVEECENRCGNVQDLCILPAVVGPCRASIPRYYYDSRTDSCYEFGYGGCQGNGNNFEDKNSCEQRCRKSAEVTTTTVRPQPVTESAPASSTCSLPRDPGPCNNDITAYFYDTEAGACQAFVYGGCEGNANRFQTEEQCERLCGSFQGQDVCNIPSDPGPCLGAFPKFYYDPNTRSCHEFSYGGCDGNANRFTSAEECESICVHREEPPVPGNKTTISDIEICNEPVSIGSCSVGQFKRFYYNDELQNCIAFVYTGCGGNRNRFKNYDSCMRTCSSPMNEVDVGPDEPEPKDPCLAAQTECNTIRCPYGKEEYVDEQNCQRCQCADPCRTEICPEGSKCAITLVPQGDLIGYRSVCRSILKPGNCPKVSNTTRCEQECSSDADCTEDLKCCTSGCGSSCLRPAPIEPITTTLAPEVGFTVPYPGAEPAAIQQPEEPKLRAEEGGYVNLLCSCTGSPRPTITWRKGVTLIDNSLDRYSIGVEGTLRIINLYRTDAGIYTCTADNHLAAPVRIQYELDITDGQDRAPEILGEPNFSVTVTLNSPAVLPCNVIGWPRPLVTWWHEDRLLPISVGFYNLQRDNSLRIQRVDLVNLGVYTCQAYNGIQRPTSWSVILQAPGPVFNLNSENQKYAKYLIEPQRRPETTKPPNIALTYPTLYSNRNPYVPPLVTEPPPAIVPGPRIVPVRVNVSADKGPFPERSEVNISCNVDGYPIPRVAWLKDNAPIQPSNRITMSETSLIISDADKSDSGRYHCQAFNEYSSAEDSVEIEVAGIFIHPNCKDTSFYAKCDLIVKAKFCRHTYYARFCCRSCTEAGQLPAKGPHINETRRKRRSILSFL